MGHDRDSLRSLLDYHSQLKVAKNGDHLFARYTKLGTN